MSLRFPTEEELSKYVKDQFKIKLPEGFEIDLSKLEARVTNLVDSQIRHSADAVLYASYNYKIASEIDLDQWETEAPFKVPVEGWLEYVPSSMHSYSDEDIKQVEEFRRVWNEQMNSTTQEFRTPIIGKSCDHPKDSIKEYVGFTQRYKFCEKCDHKFQ